MKNTALALLVVVMGCGSDKSPEILTDTDAGRDADVRTDAGTATDASADARPATDATLEIDATPDASPTCGLVGQFACGSGATGRFCYEGTLMVLSTTEFACANPPAGQGGRGESCVDVMVGSASYTNRCRGDVCAGNLRCPVDTCVASFCP